MKIGDYGRAHVCDSDKEEVKSPPWSDLPIDILGLIMGKCYLVDQIRIRVVCKSWSVVNGVPSVDKNIPWLMTYNWDKADGNMCKFFDPFLKQIYTIENEIIGEEEKKDFTGATIVASKNGWLLLQNSKRPSPFFFYNPFKMEIIKLPSLKLDVEYSCKATFSTTPTSPDCVIFVVEGSENSNLIIISTYHCGDTEWHRTYILVEFFNYVKDMVYSKGTLYCVFDDGMLASFCVANHDWSILNEQQLLMENPFQYEFHMVESDGDLEVVCVGKPPLLIFRFDWSTMAWIKEKRLGNRAIFINKTSCAISAAGETRNLGDRIYCHGDMYTWFYSLEMGKGELCSEFYPWAIKGNPKRVWIECPQL